MSRELQEFQHILNTVFTGYVSYEEQKVSMYSFNRPEDILHNSSDPRMEILQVIIDNEQGYINNETHSLLKKLSEERLWVKALHLLKDYDAIVNLIDSDDPHVRAQAVRCLAGSGGDAINILVDEYHKRFHNWKFPEDDSNCHICKDTKNRNFVYFIESLVNILCQVNVASVAIEFVIELYQLTENIDFQKNRRRAKPCLLFNADDGYYLDEDEFTGQLINLLVEKDDKVARAILIKACKNNFNPIIAEYLWTHGYYKFAKELIQDCEDGISEPTEDGQIEHLIYLLNILKYDSEDDGEDEFDTPENDELEVGKDIIELLTDANCSKEMEEEIDDALIARAGTSDELRSYALDALINRGNNNDKIDVFLFDLVLNDNALYEDAFKGLIDRDKTDTLVKLLVDYDDETCLEAINMFEKYRCTEVLPQLKELLLHEDKEIKQCARSAIKTLKSKS